MSDFLMYLYYASPRLKVPETEDLALRSFYCLVPRIVLIYDPQLSLLLIAFIPTIQKDCYEFSCNPQSFLSTPNPSFFGQEITWFYLEAAGHMMETYIGYKIIAV